MTIAALAIAAATADAQANRNARRGFWLSFGVGGGSIGSQCGSCTTNRVEGGAGYVRLGGTLSQKLLLGGELAGWSMSNVMGVDQSLAVAMINLQWYPDRRGAFYLKLGVGGLGYRWDNGTTVSHDDGPAFGLGAGYDIRIARNASIVPFINAYRSAEVKREMNGVRVPLSETLTRDMVQLGVGLTLH